MERICRYCGTKIEIDSDYPVRCGGCGKELQLKEVISPWSLDARINQLKAMHELMCQANDEFIYLHWIGLMPDEATEEDFKDIALNDEEYNECFDFFIKLIAKKGNRW